MIFMKDNFMEYFYHDKRFIMVKNYYFQPFYNSTSYLS